MSYDPTEYVQRARVTKAAPPKPAANPLQFVQIKPCNLYQQAQEQLKRAEEVKKVKEIVKEEPEDWQSVSWIILQQNNIAKQNKAHTHHSRNTHHLFSVFPLSTPRFFSTVCFALLVLFFFYFYFDSRFSLRATIAIMTMMIIAADRQFPLAVNGSFHVAFFATSECVE